MKTETTHETINAHEPTLFGYPVQLSVKLSNTETVDLTHALRWDGKGTITLDQTAVHHAINHARVRGLGLPRPPS